MDEYKVKFAQANTGTNPQERDNIALLNRMQDVRLMALNTEKKDIVDALANGELDEDLFDIVH